MTITLFGTGGSGSAAVEMALHAAALEYRMVRASSWEPDSNYQELLGVNPLGQIPTLVLDDGTVLSESAAILIHLGLAHPASELLPGAASECAMHIRGLVYIASNCYACVSISDYPHDWTTAPTKEAHESVRLAARAQLHRRWSIFADAFALHVSVTNPGALAMLAVVVSQWSGARTHLQSEKPGFYAQLMQLESHPKLAATLRAHRGL